MEIVALDIQMLSFWLIIDSVRQISFTSSQTDANTFDTKPLFLGHVAGL